MITVKEAKKLVQKNTRFLSAQEIVSLDKALFRTLAKDVKAPIAMPPFRQAAMDGYALHKGSSKVYTLISELKAGDARNPTLKPGEAARIFTGAPVPDRANAVAMQEKTHVEGKTVTLTEDIAPGTNIRPKGEQIKKGDIALKKGEQLNPAAIGFLAALGITHVTVCQKPTISIVVTGSELTPPGKALSYGEIYESNAAMLKSALLSTGRNAAKIIGVKDDYLLTLNALKTAKENAEAVLITGGISVGEYDFVGRALKKMGVKQVFYKVKQKPGKPLYFGTLDRTVFFALPGNPAAALTCFYHYVVPCLDILEGKNHFGLPTRHMPLCASYEKKQHRAEFLKARINAEGTVRILEGQSSAMLHTYAQANALVYIDETQTKIKKGAPLPTLILPV